MNFLLDPALLLWRKRGVLLATVRNDVRCRYAGGALGLLWVALYPLLLLGAYAAVFLYVYNVRFHLLGSGEYVAVIFCGLVPFLAFSEALSGGTVSVTGNANLVKNTMFPIELVPVKAVLLGQPMQIVGTILLVTAAAAMGKVTVCIVLLPVIWALQLMLTVGVVWILSALNVYLRDLQNIVALLVLVLMMISPIGYPAEAVPEGLRPLLAANPLYYMIICYQDVVVRGRWPAVGAMAALACMSVASFYLGYWFFTRLKRVFADNV